MTSLWDHLACTGGEPRVRAKAGVAAGMTVKEALRRLEAGERIDSLGLSRDERLAVVAFAALNGPGTLGPSLVQAQPVHALLEPHLNEAAVGQLYPEASRAARLALAAGLLQIHDFWEASHEAAQVADDLGERSFSAYWHGIAHRREPDAGNAAYWFRKIGRHPLFPALHDAARALLEAHGDDRLAERLLSHGAWNPSAMIDLCTEARPGSPNEALARRLQRLEMQLLLDATAAAAAGPS
jgi:hypothetical protein